jgi:hypothetical protein
LRLNRDLLCLYETLYRMRVDRFTARVWAHDKLKSLRTARKQFRRNFETKTKTDRGAESAPGRLA